MIVNETKSYSLDETSEDFLNELYENMMAKSYMICFFFKQQLWKAQIK